MWFPDPVTTAKARQRRWWRRRRRRETAADSLCLTFRIARRYPCRSAARTLGTGTVVGDQVPRTEPVVIRAALTAAGIWRCGGWRTCGCGSTAVRWLRRTSGNAVGPSAFARAFPAKSRCIARTGAGAIAGLNTPRFRSGVPDPQAGSRTWSRRGRGRRGGCIAAGAFECSGFGLFRGGIRRRWLTRIVVFASIHRFPFFIERENPACQLRIFRIKLRLIHAKAGRGTAGGCGRRRAYGLRVQVNDHPSQIVVPQLLISPDDRSDGFGTPADAVHLRLSHVRVVARRPVFRIVQSCDGQPDHHSQPHLVLRQRFLQDDEAPRMLLFIRQDTAKRHLATECIQRILRLKDGGVDPQHLKLLQISTAFIPHANQSRRSGFGTAGSHARLLTPLPGGRRIEKGVVGSCRNL